MHQKNLLFITHFLGILYFFHHQPVVLRLIRDLFLDLLISPSRKVSALGSDGKAVCTGRAVLQQRLRKVQKAYGRATHLPTTSYLYQNFISSIYFPTRNKNLMSLSLKIFTYM